MKERRTPGAEGETGRYPAYCPNVLSFGKVEDLVEELVARPPDGNVVRVDSCLKDSDGNGAGLRLRTASVLITARRIDELLVANMVHSYYRTFHNQALLERDLRLAKENDLTVRRVIEAQLRGHGFSIYLSPQYVHEKLGRAMYGRRDVLSFTEKLAQVLHRPTGNGADDQEETE